MHLQPVRTGHDRDVNDAHALKQLKQHRKPKESLHQSQPPREVKNQEDNPTELYRKRDNLKNSLISYQAKAEMQGHAEDDHGREYQIDHQLHLFLAAVAMTIKKGIYVSYDEFSACHRANIRIFEEF